MKLPFNIEIGFNNKKAAGLIWVFVPTKDYEFNIHLWTPHDRYYGYSYDWYDGEFFSFGLGPLALLAWRPL